MIPAQARPTMLSRIPEETRPGVLLVISALAAVAIVNSPWSGAYHDVLATPVHVGPTGDGIEMKLSYWIKNGLMAIFFFFVGLELKREILEGQLSKLRVAILPIMGALGGMVVPALIFVAFAGRAGFGHGWAIPAATDIAFALGVLTLLGKRVPPALKAFLLAVAVVDDLGAIVVVAFFYTEQVALGPLMMAAAVFALLLALNRLGARSVGLYVMIGVVLWVFLYQSGISPTLSGVLVAACIPLSQQHGHSPLHEAEDDFRPWVLYGIMPGFAFANAGLVFDGIGAYVTHPVTLGASLGLILGKPIGICAMTWMGAKLFSSPLPGTNIQILGIACLAGIGFTMSLFIGALAFKDPALAVPVRLGVYAGSVLSAVLGLVILMRTLPKALTPEEIAQNDETYPFIGPDPDHAAPIDNR